MKFPIDMESIGYAGDKKFVVRFTGMNSGKVIDVNPNCHYRVGDERNCWVAANRTANWKPINDDLQSNTTPRLPEHKARNVGNSDYAEHTIQPWDIWREYSLNPWDADIVKRVLRTKEGDSRKLDYEKIIHICQERIAQIDGAYE